MKKIETLRSVAKRLALQSIASYRCIRARLHTSLTIGRYATSPFYQEALTEITSSNVRWRKVACPAAASNSFYDDSLAYALI